MSQAIPMVEIWRGQLLESIHSGHAVVCDAGGQIVQAWGDPETMIYPRSASKMVQALPLLTSGAANARRLGPEHLALACASHNGAAIHTDRVRAWLEMLGLDDGALLCGPQIPDDDPARHAMVRAGDAPCQYHNNCSGKHSGFLTLAGHIGGGPDYIAPGHPVQRAVLDAFATVTEETSPGWGIDGCSAPNPIVSLHGLARAMAWFASAHDRSDGMSQAAQTLVSAMMAHPDLVAGEGRACTRIMRALDGRGAVKTGAEGVFVAILPDLRLGVALKIADGTTRASECAIAALLVALGALAPGDPVAQSLINAPVLNRRQIVTGLQRPAPGFWPGTA